MRSIVLATTVATVLSALGCDCNVVPLVEDAGVGGGAAGGGAAAGGAAAGGTAGGSVAGGGTAGGAAGGGTAGGAAAGGAATGGGSSGGAAFCAMDTACYPGAPGTSGVGVCREGVSQCLAGTPGPCVGAILPSAEVCNGLDDDCNAAADDGLGSTTCGVGACQRTVAACVDGGVVSCRPGAPVAESCTNAIDDDCDGVVNNGCGCIHVAPTGLDTNPGSLLAPVRRITTAIAIAADAGIASVCVRGTCAGPFDYGGTNGEALTMRNGVSVYGGFNLGATARTCVTRLTATTPEGVLFDATVSSPTALDGFELIGGNFPTAAAVTVRGSTGAVINNDLIVGGAGNAVTTSIGVDVTDGAGMPATPTIANSSVTGAAVAGTAIGVRSTKSAPLITRNCGTALDAQGRCTAGCGTVGAPVSSIKGATGAGTAPTVAAAYAVFLDSSPNAVVDTSALCSVVGAAPHVTGAGVFLQGNAAGVSVRANNIVAYGATANSVGVWAAPCRNASPSISNNHQVAAASSVAGSRSDGVRVIGACNARIDNNRAISGGIEQAGQDTNGVYCASDPVGGQASQCTVLNNTLIQGSAGGYPPRSVGVRCDDGACARIDGNAHITGRGGVFSVGVIVSRAGPTIGRNLITAGCGTSTAIGLQSIDSFARVENNVIRGLTAGSSGGACAVNGMSAAQSSAVMVINANTSNELDLHSNSLFGDGPQSGCTSRALAFDAASSGTPAGAPRGLVRNNALSGGNCTPRYGLQELNASADPRVLQNNWFDRAPLGLIPYRDEGTTDLLDAGAVNALTDLTSSNNFEGACLVGPGAFKVLASGVCVDQGTATGAPRVDFEGDPRPSGAGFDVGADEVP